MLVTAVLPGLALVHLDAVELVQLPVAGQTLAHVRTERVDAARVQMAVITIKTTLLSALVDVYRTRLEMEKLMSDLWGPDFPLGAERGRLTQRRPSIKRRFSRRQTCKSFPAVVYVDVSRVSRAVSLPVAPNLNRG